MDFTESQLKVRLRLGKLRFPHPPLPRFTVYCTSILTAGTFRGGGVGEGC